MQPIERDTCVYCVLHKTVKRISMYFHWHSSFCSCWRFTILLFVYLHILSLNVIHKVIAATAAAAPAAIQTQAVICHITHIMTMMTMTMTVMMMIIYFIYIVMMTANFVIAAIWLFQFQFHFRVCVCARVYLRYFNILLFIPFYCVVYYIIV